MKHCLKKLKQYVPIHSWNSLNSFVGHYFLISKINFFIFIQKIVYVHEYVFTFFFRFEN
jgi:hypothetical protein